MFKTVTDRMDPSHFGVGSTIDTHSGPGGDRFLVIQGDHPKAGGSTQIFLVECRSFRLLAGAVMVSDPLHFTEDEAKKLVSACLPRYTYTDLTLNPKGFK